MGEAWTLVGMLVTFSCGFTLGWILRGRPGGPSGEWQQARWGPDPLRPPAHSPWSGVPSPADAVATAPAPADPEPVPPREHPVNVVEGIGPGYTRRLAELGVETTLDLIEGCRKPETFEEICTQLGVQEAVLRRWACQCDLLRVPDLDAQAAELLEAAGVLRVRDLLAEDPTRLARKLSEVNDELRLTPGDVPDATMLVRWMNLGRRLDTS